VVSAYDTGRVPLRTEQFVAYVKGAYGIDCHSISAENGRRQRRFIALQI
jgi:hypothetical protein